MFKSIITAAVIALGLSLTPVYAAEQAAQPEQQAADSNTWTSGFTGQAGSGSVNWFDPSTWGGAAAAGTPLQFNPAHPAGWAMFFDPATHAKAHQAFSNPATYAQFMTPQFYMQFMNPNNWMAWMNPASYGAFINPANYAYWMNPAAYTHVMDVSQYMQAMNPASYTAFMNPMTYMQWMNPAAYSIPGMDVSAAGTGGFNWFDPAAWGGFMSPGQPAEATK
jgi:hypothetical protein